MSSEPIPDIVIPNITTYIPRTTSASPFSLGDFLGNNVGGLLNFGTNLLNYFNERDLQKYKKELQERMFQREDTAIQRRVADLKAAGLNPLLAAGEGAGTGQETSVSAAHMGQVNVAEKLAIQTAKQQLLQQKFNTEIAEAGAEEADLQREISRHDMEVEKDVWRILNTPQLEDWTARERYAAYHERPEVQQRLHEYMIDYVMKHKEYEHDKTVLDEDVRHLNEERNFYENLPGDEYGWKTILGFIKELIGVGSKAYTAAGSHKKGSVNINKSWVGRQTNMY